MERYRHYIHSIKAVLLTLVVVFVSVGLGAQSAPSGSLIQISDVVGLANALALRPMMGVGYGSGLTAVINAEGQIDGAVGNLPDCVLVDGTSIPCGGSTSLSGPSFADNETPAGVADGTRVVFTLQYTPIPGSIHLYVDGLRVALGLDMTISSNVITFFVASTPSAGAVLLADYRFLPAS